MSQLTKELTSLRDRERARASAWFFKTGKGQYGEGDVFLGIDVPTQRKIAKKYIGLSLADVQKLLKNEIHEFRLVALFILVLKYTRADEKGKKEIVDFYLKNAKRVNNWDLVDSSAGYILGDYLYHKCHPERSEGSRKDSSAPARNASQRVAGGSPQNDNNEKAILYKLAESENIWERRIAIISTQGFIRRNQYDDTLKIAEILINDKHDLIHKAVGWMLREVGKKDLNTLCGFLDRHYKNMPRTMLRYAIEKFEKDKKEFYMKKGN